MEKQRERFYGIWMLPEMISCLLVFITLFWDVFFLRQVPKMMASASLLKTEFAMLACLVWLNSVIVFIRAIVYLRRERQLPRIVLWQLIVGLLSSVAFILYHSDLTLFGDDAVFIAVGMSGCIGIGLFGLVNIRDYWRIRQEKTEKVKTSAFSPAVIFFTTTFGFVVLSSLVLMTPAATYDSISLPDAFFLTASATTSTGLSSVDIPSTFTPLGKAILLIDIEMGTIGVMTFAYFVLMMVGKKLAIQDSANVSGLLDQEGLSIVPSLIKSVVLVTLISELIGALFLYMAWYDNPCIPDGHLWAYALFHSVSAFCCAGISLFPNNMAEACVAYDKVAQTIMMVVMLMGMLGFGVYLEGMTRLRKRFQGLKVLPRWSTHCWLAMRAMIVATIICALGLALLGIFEPSANEQSTVNTAWEALWNSVGRSAGFNISTVDNYGIGYKFFLILTMMVGGNPAGTGGGFFAPVLAICILEVIRVLRGKRDLEIHQRRISKTTVRRAMVTLAIGTAWLYFLTIVFIVMEPQISAQPNGFQLIMFEVASAFSTCGFSLGITSELSDASKILMGMNMIFGRVGVFTFMMLFVRQSEQKPLRYPETKLPLS